MRYLVIIGLISVPAFGQVADLQAGNWDFTVGKFTGPIEITRSGNSFTGLYTYAGAVLQAFTGSLSVGGTRSEDLTFKWNSAFYQNVPGVAQGAIFWGNVSGNSNSLNGSFGLGASNVLGSWSATRVVPVVQPPVGEPTEAPSTTACSTQTLLGPYTYALSGEYLDARGTRHSFASAGRIVFDGTGGGGGKDTSSDSGTIARARSYKLSYTLESDCTGSARLEFESGAALMDLVVTNRARTIHFIQTDPGATISGTALQQFPAQ